MGNKKKAAKLHSLIPVRTLAYDISSRIISRLYSPNCLKDRSVYHVWLDCLYQPDVKSADVLQELSRITRSQLSKKDIFIVSIALANGMLQPAGSCYIVLSQRIVSERDILDLGLHMIEVSITVLRKLLKENCLVFHECYAGYVPIMGPPLIASMAPASTLAVMSNNNTNSDSNSSSQNPETNQDAGPSQNSKTIQNIGIAQNAGTSQNAKVSEREPDGMVKLNPILVKINSQERSKSILTQVSGSSNFLRFRMSGQKDFPLDLLNNTLFDRQTSRPDDNIKWHDVYINGNGMNSNSGVIVLKKFSSLKQTWQKSLQKNKDTIINMDGVIIKMILVDYGNFKSTVLNINNCWEYKTKIVATKRKTPPLIVIDDDSDVESSKLVIDEQATSSQQSNQYDRNELYAATRDFVPVTYETIRYALNLMEKYTEEKRMVQVVFDTCFSDVNITLDAIRKKFEPLFGCIENSCVLIKSSLDQLMPNLDEAYNREYTLRGQAYIIASKGIDFETFNRRAGDLNILYGSMTMGCVVMNLKKGVYVMHKGALFEAGASFDSVVRRTGSESLQHKVDGQFDIGLNIPKTGKAKTSINVESICKKDNEASTSKGSDSGLFSFEEKVWRKMASDLERSDIVGGVLPKLTQLGNVVVKVENLTANLTVHTLNLMMGTFTLTSERIIGNKIPRKKGEDLMNIRIVFASNDNDLQKILDKNKCKTPQNQTLLIQRTDLKELEKFLLKNYNNLHRLLPGHEIPINSIGYGKVQM